MKRIGWIAVATLGLCYYAVPIVLVILSDEFCELAGVARGRSARGSEK
jgi:hypothetical protein